MKSLTRALSSHGKAGPAIRLIAKPDNLIHSRSDAETIVKDSVGKNNNDKSLLGPTQILGDDFFNKDFSDNSSGHGKAGPAIRLVAKSDNLNYYQNEVEKVIKHDFGMNSSGKDDFFNKDFSDNSSSHGKAGPAIRLVAKPNNLNYYQNEAEKVIKHGFGINSTNKDLPGQSKATLNEMSVDSRLIAKQDLSSQNWRNAKPKPKSFTSYCDQIPDMNSLDSRLKVNQTQINYLQNFNKNILKEL